MTMEEAEKQIAKIRKNRRDDEMAHGLEDTLHEAVLEHIAEHSNDPESAALAETALSTRDIEFSRWCA